MVLYYTAVKTCEKCKFSFEYSCIRIINTNIVIIVAPSISVWTSGQTYIFASKLLYLTYYYLLYFINIIFS